MTKEEYLKKIEFLKGYDSAEEISGGHSAIAKFKVAIGEKSYFVKISAHKFNEKAEKLLSEMEIPHAKVYATGKISENTFFIVEEFIDKPVFKSILDFQDAKYIYERAYNIGLRYSKFRKIYPDRKLTQSEFVGVLEKFERETAKFEDFVKENRNLESLPNWDKFICLKNFYQSHIKDIKNSSLVFGHTDIHPSNFLLDRELIAIDFDSTGFAEIATALRWGLVSSQIDRQDKHIAFSQGYLEGLFQFNVPKNVRKALNCMFAFMVCREALEFLKHGKTKEFSKYIDKIFSYFKNNEIEFPLTFDISQIRTLENVKKITITPGSYSDNLVFKCCCKDRNYLLKVMPRNAETLELYLSFYDMLASHNISAPQVYESGVLNNKYIFVLFEFIEGEQWHKILPAEDYKVGQECGRKIARLFNRLQDVKDDKISTFTIEDFNKFNLSALDIIYSSEKAASVMPVSKEKLTAMLKKYSKDFKNEPLRLIHGDIKFGNILAKNDDIFIVDNENYHYSYEIVNFRYNIATKFLDDKLDLKKGFYNGYFDEIYGGKLPKRLQGQAKYMALSHMISCSKSFAENALSNRYMQTHKTLLENGFYDKEIEWLK